MTVVVLIILSSLANSALADPDGPMRTAGSFAAKAEGAVAGSISGDATVSQNKNATHLYLTLNSDQMIALKVMISADVCWPRDAAAGKHNLLNTMTATVSWESMETRARHAVAATGTIEFNAKDPMAGRFELNAKDGGETLKITGTFQNAPVMDGIN